jgi:acyl-CoA hydrolase/RimJ/RimL family protein N-acetyltransferase
MCMNSWRERYADKELTPKAAIDKIQPGQKLFFDSGCSEPQMLLNELIAQHRRLKDIEINHILSIVRNLPLKNKPEDLFRYNNFFIAAQTIRDAVNEGQADYTPIFLSEISNIFKSGRRPIDVALIQVSPPDKNNYCSFGINVDVAKPIAEAADLVIAEINPNVPRTYGNSFIPMKKIDFFVYSEIPLLEFQMDSPDEIHRKIAMNTATLVRNGATLQVGIGNAPQAVLTELVDHKDLGIHTDSLFDGFIDLIESGVINCERKSVNQGRAIANYGLGTRRLFNFVDNNPFIEFHPASYTNNPFNIAQNDRMTAINGALSVDLTGQVNSESLGNRFYSGIGGLVDFCRGASYAKDGVSVICLPSTASKGNISRIVPMFEAGTHVSLTMADVRYIVTEYGVANLHGKNIRERIMALISIAHPKFRRYLLDEAKKMQFVYSDQKLAADDKGNVILYPKQYERTYSSPTGESVFFRPILPTDERMIQDLFYSLDDESRIFRFFQPKKYFLRQDSTVDSNIYIDYENIMALVGFSGDIGDEKMIALCSYERDNATNMGEIAFTVSKKWRNKGLTKFMLHYLIRIAKEKGLDGFQGEILWENKAMVHIIRDSGYIINGQTREDDWVFSFRFDSKI